MNQIKFLKSSSSKISPRSYRMGQNPRCNLHKPLPFACCVSSERLRRAIRSLQAYCGVLGAAALCLRTSSGIANNTRSGWTLLGCKLLPFAIKLSAVHKIGHCSAGCRFTKVVGRPVERGCDRPKLLTTMNQALEILEDRLSVAVAVLVCCAVQPVRRCHPSRGTLVLYCTVPDQICKRR